MADTGNLYREIGALKAAASERTEYYARIIREQAKRIAELEADLEYYKSGFHSERGVHERVAAILGTDDAPWMLAQRAIERIAELTESNKYLSDRWARQATTIVEMQARMAKLETILSQAKQVIIGFQKSETELRDESGKRRKCITELKRDLKREEGHTNAYIKFLHESEAKRRKQRAALKVLGKRSGQRGKALVRLERIIDIFGPVDGDQLEALLAYRKCKGHDDIATQALGRAAKAARVVQQLRREGKL